MKSAISKLCFELKIEFWRNYILPSINFIFFGVLRKYLPQKNHLAPENIRFTRNEFHFAVK